MEVHVKELFDDLFKDWSKTYVRTRSQPKCSRRCLPQRRQGLDISKIKGSYTQESYFSNALNLGTATVRFALPNGGWWERFIDQADRFDKKSQLQIWL